MSDEMDRTGTIVTNHEVENMYLNFVVGKEIYGIGVCSVVQIIAMQKISEMPEMRPNMKGFINLCGNVIPVYSMHSFLGKTEPEYTERACIMVISVADQQLGLIADSIMEAVTVYPDSISPPPMIGTAGIKDYVNGIAHLTDGQTIVLLNLSSLFV